MNIKLYIFSAVAVILSYSGLTAQVPLSVSIQVDFSGATTVEGDTYFTQGNQVPFTITFVNNNEAVEVPSGNGVDQTQIDNANNTNTARTANAVDPDAILTGTDIYGNTFEIPATIAGSIPFNLGPGVDISIEGSVTVPNDGTLHDMSLAGHRIALTYDYTNSGAPFAGTGGSNSNILFNFPPNLKITDLAYPSGTFKGGDIIQIAATVKNERPDSASTQTRPILSADDFRTNLYLTEDASVDTGNDFLLGVYTLEGDRTQSVDGESSARHVGVNFTPALISTYNRNYTPQPDDRKLDIGEEVTVRYEVMVPHNYVGSFYVAAFTDSLLEITETQEGEDATFETTQGDNFLVDNNTPRIKIESTNSPDTLPVSVVSDEVPRPISDESNGLSDEPAISESGDWIVFHSLATNLDTNYDPSVSPNRPTLGNYNIYLRQRSTGKVQLISRNNSGVPANADSKNPAISGDGRYIAFESKASNLVTGTTGASSQIYLYDRENEQVKRVSISSQGLPANGNCYLPSINSNGRFIVFESTATNLDLTYATQLGSDSLTQVFIHDRDVNGSTTFTNNYDTYLVSEQGGIVGNSHSATIKISLDGDVVAFVSDATNLGSATGGFKQIWMRNLSNGEPTGDISLVSVNDSGTVANRDCTQPAINAGKGAIYGLQIAFSSAANNLVNNDANDVNDIFVRGFPNGSPASTSRVSLSNPKVSYGTITFRGAIDPLTNLAIDPLTGLATNQPSFGDTITLNDGINNPTQFTFGPDVAIGALGVEQTRDNLIDAINTAPNLDIFAYASDPAGQRASIMLYNLNTGIVGDQAIQTTSLSLNVSGMSDGGVETGDLEAKYELNEALGSLQPSIDRTGRTVAFRSLVSNISVANNNTNYVKGTSNPTFGTPSAGTRLRVNDTNTSKVYYIDRDISNSGILDTPDNTDTVCASVNKFGYPTNIVRNFPNSGSSRVPALSADGRFIAFASESTNTGGLRFDRTNTQVQDDNNKRDVFLHVRPSVAPVDIIDENLPYVVVTNPTDGSELSFGTPVFLNAGAFGYVQSTGTYSSAGVNSVEFFVNGKSVGVDTQTPFSLLYQPTSLDDLRIRARVTDTRGNVEASNVVNVSVITSAFETTLLNLKTPGTTSGDSFSVGDSIVLESEIIDTAGSAQFTERYELIRVSYLVNGVSIYSTENVTIEAPDFDYTYALQAPGTSSINAMATYRSTSPGSNETRDVFSETFSVEVAGIDIENNDRDFINDVFERLVARNPTARERDTGLQILSSGQSRASYIATLLDSSSLENSATAALIYRTMLGEWPNKVALDQAIADVRRGAATGDANALTLVLLPQYEAQFSTLNTDLGFIQQTFFNKHGVSLSPQNQIRLTATLSGESLSINERIVPGYLGDTITYFTQFALDNDTSGLIGPNGLPLSNLHLYEMPNTLKDDFKIALAISAYLEVDPTDELVASYSNMSLEQAIEKILSGGSAASSVLAGASSLGSDWYDSSWFGMFYMSSDSSNWVYSWRLGWVYVAPSSTPSAAWFYSDKLKAWLWSGSGLNGFYYHSSSSRKAWTYLLPAEADASGAWLYYFDTKQWELVRP